MNATAAVGVMLLVTTFGCAAEPEPLSPTATPPLGEEPCDSDVLARALAAVAGVKGYRFTQEISWSGPPQHAGGERQWTHTRTSGAFLAPGRYHEEVVSTDDPLGPSTGFVRAVSVDGSTWRLVPAVEGRAEEWREVPQEVHGGNVLSVVTTLVGDTDLEPAGAAPPPSLPGEGGCVMVASGRRAVGGDILAVRIDAAGPRIVAFEVAGEESRWRMEINYQLPERDEFVVPTVVSPDS